MGPHSDTAPLPERPRWHRWAWFVGLYVAGLLTIALVSYSLRWLIQSGI